MMVATETHYVGTAGNAVAAEPGPPVAVASRPIPPYASASVNAHIEGVRIPQDLITIPAEQIQ
jgi:hypothetical protein